MRLTIFLSVLSTHQQGLCNAFYSELGEDFKAVFFEELPAYRVEAGFKDMSKEYPYCIQVPKNISEEEKVRFVQNIVDESDVGIVGAAPNYIFDLFLARSKRVFLYSERFYKKGTWRRWIPKTYHKAKSRFRNHPLFEVLCASAYLPYDLRLTGYRGKCLQWGYFPHIQQFERKEKQCGLKRPVSILWVGRLIGLKHPETAIYVAERLKKDGYSFEMKLLGYGKLKEKIGNEIAKKQLGDCVELCDAVPPEDVHRMMREADIFLATSDYHEGWGVTINESLTQGCCVIASRSMGSAPFLIQDGVNGFLCRWNEPEAYYIHTKKLIDSKETAEYISQNAYRFMRNDFSPAVAAKRFTEYCDGKIFENGICSEAPILRR